MTAQVIDTDHGEPRRLDERAAIRFTPAGRPLALRWHGTIWQVVGDSFPQAAAGRAQAMRVGVTPGTTSAWLFTAQTGPASPVLEFGIGFDDRREEWRLLSVAGARG